MNILPMLAHAEGTRFRHGLMFSILNGLCHLSRNSIDAGGKTGLCFRLHPEIQLGGESNEHADSSAIHASRESLRGGAKR